MSGRFIIIPPQGPTTVEQRASEPTLEEWQKAVGGYIQQVVIYYDNEKRYAYVNEDGQHRPELAINLDASALCVWPAAGVLLVGNVALWIEDADPIAK